MSSGIVNLLRKKKSEGKGGGGGLNPLVEYGPGVQSRCD